MSAWHVNPALRSWAGPQLVQLRAQKQGAACKAPRSAKDKAKVIKPQHGCHVVTQRAHLNMSSRFLSAACALKSLEKLPVHARSVRRACHLSTACNPVQQHPFCTTPFRTVPFVPSPLADMLDPVLRSDSPPMSSQPWCPATPPPAVHQLPPVGLPATNPFTAAPSHDTNVPPDDVAECRVRVFAHPPTVHQELPLRSRPVGQLHHLSLVAGVEGTVQAPLSGAAQRVRHQAGLLAPVRGSWGDPVEGQAAGVVEAAAPQLGAPPPGARQGTR